ncbi:hypothetical protein C3L33_01350, partial [Rhododendron williamsianum]
MSIAKHYETGETLPEDVYRKILAARTFRAGSLSLHPAPLHLRRLQVRRVLHSDKIWTGCLRDHCEIRLKDHTAATSGDDLFAACFVYPGQREAPVKPVTTSSAMGSECLRNDVVRYGFCGYAAGYYSYKWAEVLSADAFSAFEDAGLNDEKAVKETGHRFRETILALGGGKAPLEVFVEFRGREPSPEALLRHNGLLPVSTSA